MREAATIAKLPLVVRVLFISCLAMLTGNALVLILNLEIVESADSTVVHARPGSDLNLLKPFLVHAATAEPEFSRMAIVFWVVLCEKSSCHHG